MAEDILALDFGGTKLAAARFCAGRLAAATAAPSPAHKSAPADRELALRLAEQVLAGRRPAAVRVSFGGLVQGQVVLLSHHVPGWEGFRLASWCEEQFGAPATVDNDANAGAVGEWAHGAGRGAGSLFYVTVSTGIGGGWVVGGRPFRGADGLAGEIGHLTVVPDGPMCTCGRRGCLEAVAAGPGIARRAGELLAARPAARGPLRRALTAAGELTAAQVASAAEQGDAVARQALLEAATALGQALGTVTCLMNPELTVVGGGVAKSGEPFLQAVRSAARQYVLPQARLTIVPAELGDQAPLWGAAARAGQLLR
ncbi:MAG: ROK family protein [Candidatus Bipolaricaulaceae bacterium]